MIALPWARRARALSCKGRPGSVRLRCCAAIGSARSTSFLGCRLDSAQSVHGEALKATAWVVRPPQLPAVHAGCAGCTGRRCGRPWWPFRRAPKPLKNNVSEPRLCSGFRMVPKPRVTVCRWVQRLRVVYWYHILGARTLVTASRPAPPAQTTTMLQNPDETCNQPTIFLTLARAAAYPHTL